MRKLLLATTLVVISSIAFADDGYFVANITSYSSGKGYPQGGTFKYEPRWKTLNCLFENPGPGNTIEFWVDNNPRRALLSKPTSAAPSQDGVEFDDVPYDAESPSNKAYFEWHYSVISGNIAPNSDVKCEISSPTVKAPS